jgi:hypothetical protein
MINETKKLVDVRTCCQFSIFKNREDCQAADPTSTPKAMANLFPMTMQSVPANAMDIRTSMC